MVGPCRAALAASCRAASELLWACSVRCLLRRLAVFHQAMQLLSHFQGTAKLFFFCLPLFPVLRVALGVAHAAVVVDVLPLLLPSSLLSGQLGWWLVVLAASGVSCLQLRLYAAVYHCCCLSPAADVAAAGRKLIYSLGAVVAAAGLLQRCAGSSSWLAACPPVFDWASCQTSFLQLLLLMWLLQLVVGGPAGEGVIFSLSPLLHREPCQLIGSLTHLIHFEGVYGLARGSPLLLVLLLLLPVGQGRVAYTSPICTPPHGGQIQSWGGGSRLGWAEDCSRGK